MARDLRVPVQRLERADVELPPDIAKYVQRVHRKREGDSLLLFDPESACEANAIIVSERPLVVRVDEPRAAPDASLPVELWQGVGKGDKPEQVVRDATVLGARVVQFLETERTVVRGSNKATRLGRVAVEAARQAGRGNVPRVVGPHSLPEALAKLPEPQAAEARWICAWTADVEPLGPLVEQVDWERALVRCLIGPEGGFSDAEVELARRAGFRPVSLGPLVLRTETAATVVLGALRLAAFRRAAPAS